MDREYCAHCICLVEGEEGEWICDELEVSIEDVEECPNEDPDKIGCKECDWTGLVFDYAQSVRNWQIEESPCPKCNQKEGGDY